MDAESETSIVIQTGPSKPATSKEKNGLVCRAPQLSVDAEKAGAFIICTYPTMSIECNRLPASESTTFWINKGIVGLRAGHARRYQEIARRNSYFSNLAERFNLSPEEMNRYLMQNSISNAEHEKLLPPDPQFDMFSTSQGA